MVRITRATLIGAGVTAASLTVLAWLAHRESDFHRQELVRETRLVAHQVARQLWAGLEHQRIGLQQTANFFRNSRQVTEEEFYDFASATLRLNRACLRLSYIDANFRLQWVHPLEENRELLGTPMRAHPDTFNTLVRAAQSREAVLSPPLELLGGARGFLLAVPIYRDQNFLGLVTEAFRSADFFAAMVLPEVLERYRLNVLESGLTPIFTSQPATSPQTEWPAATEEFTQAGSHWVVELAPWDPLLRQRLASGNASFWGIGGVLALSLGGVAALAAYLLLGFPASGSTPWPAAAPGVQAGGATAASAAAQGEKLAALSRFLSGLAQEMNNPLCSVLGYSQILKAAEVSTHVRSRLDIIHTEAERMSELLRSLLTFAGKHPPERKHLGLNGIVEKALEHRACNLKFSQIEIEKSLAPDLPKTLLDFHQIQQVILQLLGNAEQAMVEAGRRGDIRISTHSLGERIELRIADDGPGIDPALHDRIFEPFFTTRQARNSVGLGLALCYGIVREHEGTIHVESRPGQGATFVVGLPVLSSPPSGAQDAPQDEARPGRHLRVLVVDPEISLQDLLVDLLTGKGHLVDTASDTPEALRKISESSYDLIVTEVKMPRGTGKEIYEAVVGKSPALAGRIVYTSSEGTRGSSLEFFRDIGGEILRKPFRIEEVEKAIASALVR